MIIRKSRRGQRIPSNRRPGDERSLLRRRSNGTFVGRRVTYQEVRSGANRERTSHLLGTGPHDLLATVLPAISLVGSTICPVAVLCGLNQAKHDQKKRYSQPSRRCHRDSDRYWFAWPVISVLPLSNSISNFSIDLDRRPHQFRQASDWMNGQTSRDPGRIPGWIQQDSRQSPDPLGHQGLRLSRTSTASHILHRQRDLPRHRRVSRFQQNCLIQPSCAPRLKYWVGSTKREFQKEVS